MTAMPFSFPIFKAFTTTGTLGPLAGGLLHTFKAGTSTPLAVYQDAALTTPHTNPVVLDSNGQATIYLGPNAYKMRLEDSTGAVQPGWPIDNIEDQLDSAKTYTDTLRSDLAASSGSSLVGFIQSGSGAVPRTVQDKERDVISVFDFMTAAQIADVKARTATIDVSAAINAALQYASSISGVVAPDYVTPTRVSGGATVYFPNGVYLCASMVELPDFVRMLGESKYGTVIKSTYDGYVVRNTLGAYYDALGQGIKNLSILGDRTKTSQVGIALLRPYLTEISDVLVSSCGGDGIRILQGLMANITRVHSTLNVGCGLKIDLGLDSWANPVANTYPSNANMVVDCNLIGNDAAGLVIQGKHNSNIIQGCAIESNYRLSQGGGNTGYNIEVSGVSDTPNKIIDCWVEGGCKAHIYLNMTSSVGALEISRLSHYGNGASGNVDRCLIVNSGRVSLNNCFGHGASYKNIAGSIAPFRVIKANGYIQLVNCAGSTLGQNLAGYDGMIEDENGLTTGLFNNKKIINYNYHYGDQIFRSGTNAADMKLYGDASTYPILTLDTYNRGIWHGSGSATPTVIWRAGSGSPENVVAAGIGSLFTRTDGGAGTTLYVKESGTGNTGWVAK